MHVGRDIALAHTHFELHLKRDVLGQGGNVLLGIQHGDVLVLLNVGGSHRALAIHPEREALRFVGIHAQAYLLEVEHEIRHVLKHAVDGRELVLYSGNLRRDKGRPLKGGQKHTTHGVTNGSAVSALQRLAHELAVGAAGRLILAHDLIRLDQFVPVTRIDEAFALFVKHGSPALFRVKFDDQLFVDRELDVITLRQGFHRTLERSAVGFQPAGAPATGQHFLRFGDHGDLAVLFRHFHGVAHTDLQRRDVHLAAVEGEDTVTHELTGLVARVGKAHAVDDIVKATLKNDQQVGTGHALLHFGLFKVAAELAFQDAVGAAGLLLFTQLHRVFAHFLAGAAMLTGCVGTTILSTFISEATVALEEQLAALTATDAAFGFGIFGHESILL